MTSTLLWKLLSQIKTLKLDAVSVEPDWSGQAEGRVSLSTVNRHTLIFSESGEWNFTEKPRIKFFNIYRWRMRSEETLELAHLRHGMDSPVHLLDFKKTDADKWYSEKPHVCVEDLYSAVLSVKENSIFLKWTIDGPAKKQTVECLYR